MYNRRRLHVRDISLIASNCNGGVMLHDLNMEFRSPFVNLWIRPKEFVRLCENLEKYMSEELCFIKEQGICYPIGLLGDVRIYFQHYATNKEALDAWERRKKRINWDRIYLLFTDRDGCTYEDLKRFDRLKWKRKVVLVNKKYPDIKSAVYIPGFEAECCVGDCMNFINNHTYRRYFDAFDYVAWFNSGRKEKMFRNRKKKEELHIQQQNEKPTPAFLRSDYPYKAIGDSITDLDTLKSDGFYEIKCNQCEMSIRSQGSNIKSTYERLMSENGCIGCGNRNLIIRRVNI